MIECMRNAAREHMALDEQISFCEEKSKNIKLKAEPQTFVDIKNSLEKLKNPWIPVSERLPEEIDKYYLVTCRSVFCVSNLLVSSNLNVIFVSTLKLCLFV